MRMTSVIYVLCHLCLWYLLQLEHPPGDDSNGGLYDAMRKELRHVMEEIKTEIEQVCHLNLLSIISMLHSLSCLLKL